MISSFFQQSYLRRKVFVTTQNIISNNILIFLSSLSSWFKQDRQCTYNVTVRHFRAITVAVERKWISHNLCVYLQPYKYPARNGHAPSCHLWPTPLYNIFPRDLINGTIFKKMLQNIKCVFRVSLKFCLRYFSF